LALGMLIFSIVNISDAIFEVPTGILSDMVGRKYTVVLGSLAAVCYAIFYAIGTSFWILALGAIFQGISIAFYSGNNEALLHDSLKEVGKEKEYHEFLGKLSSFFQMALALGAVIGSLLASKSFAIVMWLSVIPQIICFFISLKMEEPHIYIKKSSNIYAHMKEAFGLFMANRKLRLVSFGSMLSGAVGEASFQFQAAFYNTLWPLWAIGLAKLLSYLGATFSFLFSGKLINRLKEIKVLLLGNVYSRLINTISVLIPTKLSPVLMSSTSIFYGSSFVAKSSLLQKEFTSHQRATIASLNSLGESLLFSIFAYLFGLIGDYFGPAKTVIVAQIIALIGTYFLWLVFREQKKTADK